jgi:hypothetical protein
VDGDGDEQRRKETTGERTTRRGRGIEQEKERETKCEERETKCEERENSEHMPP